MQEKMKNNNLITSQFITTTFLNFLQTILGAGLRKIRIVDSYDIEIEVTNRYIYPLLSFLQKHSNCLFKSIVDMIAYDDPKKVYRFFLIYNIISIKYNQRIRIITKIKEISKLISITSIYKSANWLEREVFDFFGIFFFENNDLRRILTDYGFKGFPLRKDYPILGYTDIYYDDNQKKICYKKIELMQEYRLLDTKTNWVHLW